MALFIPFLAGGAHAIRVASLAPRLASIAGRVKNVWSVFRASKPVVAAVGGTGAVVGAAGSAALFTGQIALTAMTVGLIAGGIALVGFGLYKAFSHHEAGLEDAGKKLEENRQEQEIAQVTAPVLQVPAAPLPSAAPLPGTAISAIAPEGPLVAAPLQGQAVQSENWAGRVTNPDKKEAIKDAAQNTGFTALAEAGNLIRDNTL